MVAVIGAMYWGLGVEWQGLIILRARETIVMAIKAGSLLVLGGARSGKSHYAQQCAEGYDGRLIYIATGQAGDSEMAERIERHQADRGPRWKTVEAPLALGSTMLSYAGPDTVLLVDCLTLWASNMMFDGADMEKASESLALDLQKAASNGRVILVSNEVGLGIVPENALARRFRDEAGRLNQKIAQIADSVVFIAAGLPLFLKEESNLEGRLLS